jgi:hypothetical protein
LSNIQNVNDKNEPVLGYFNAGITTEERIFVSFKDLPSNWYFNDAQCQLDTVLVGSLGNAAGDILISGLYKGASTRPYGFLYTTGDCGDCRASGGTTTKPSFW